MQTNRFKKTRKQRGGFDVSIIEKLLNKESIEKALNLCTKYLNEGQYGTILKACSSAGGDCHPPCFTIKYVPKKPVNNIATKLQHEILAHENYMIYLITNTLKKSADIELIHHLEQYIGSITPNSSTPWLFTENIVGVTLSSDLITPHITENTIKLYFETLLVLDYLSKLLPGFVHGDLNPGNIFLIQRTLRHKKCRYEIVTYDDSGNPTIENIDFEDRYMIKLIDFGFSECDSFKWIDHPGHPGRSIAGLWQLDAYMALDSFYHIASESNKVILKKIGTDFFGEALASEMDNAAFDIYENIHTLLDTPPKEVLFDFIKKNL